MIVRERLNKLVQECYFVNHKLFGLIKMKEGFDLIRIWDADTWKDKSIVTVDKIADIPEELLDMEVKKEEVWCMGEFTLDLFV